MPRNIIHLVGFGSQGAAWAQCLRKSGWIVEAYVARQGPGHERATQLGFQPRMISDLPAVLLEEQVRAGAAAPHWIAMMCPDSAIGPIYREFLANLQIELRLVLAHGYAVYSQELVMAKPEHQATLLAPKAIGPKLLQGFEAAFPETHELAAAFNPGSQSPAEGSIGLADVARGLGFSSRFLIPASFYQETVGDLISEQGLLCGGVFNLLLWTMEAMEKAGVPDALIREECLTELELIAGLIRDRGPADTFRAISQAAQCGTVAMETRFKGSEFKAAFDAQVASVLDQRFSEFFRSQEWPKQAKDLATRLNDWQKRFQRKE